MCNVHTTSQELDGSVLWESDIEYNHILESAELKANKVKDIIKKKVLNHLKIL